MLQGKLINWLPVKIWQNAVGKVIIFSCECHLFTKKYALFALASNHYEEKKASMALPCEYVLLICKQPDEMLHTFLVCYLIHSERDLIVTGVHWVPQQVHGAVRLIMMRLCIHDLHHIGIRVNRKSGIWIMDWSALRVVRGKGRGVQVQLRVTLQLGLKRLTVIMLPWLTHLTLAPWSVGWDHAAFASSTT